MDQLSKAFGAVISIGSPVPHPPIENRPTSNEFKGAVVLVTGAGSGIGQSCAQELARNGCECLFLVDLSLSKLEKTKASIEDASLKTQVELYEGNVSDEVSMKAMVKHCVDVYGRIDIALNVAGVSGNIARTTDVSMKDFDLVCAINERGVLLCEKYELSQMLRQEPSFGGQRGSIVNVFSIAGHCIIPTASPYAASKHAVVAITRCDALRHAQDGIRINCVSPGAAWTPMISESGFPKEFLELGAVMAPMKRYVQPIEVANAILFLAGPKASAMSGVNLPVDCGTQLLRSI